MTTTAPDIAPGYPSSGERIGPAWADVWRYLRNTSPRWRTVVEVAEAPSVARHGLATDTIGELLRRARCAGLLQVTYRECGYPLRRRACYRRAQ